MSQAPAIQSSSQQLSAAAQDHAQPPTCLFLSLSFLILRATHSADVVPVSNSPSGAFATARAIISLPCPRCRRTTELRGRVKNATEYRSKRDCVPGGGL